MSNALRWTEEQLRDHLVRNARPAPVFADVVAPVSLTSMKVAPVFININNGKDFPAGGKPGVKAKTETRTTKSQRSARGTKNAKGADESKAPQVSRAAVAEKSIAQAHLSGSHEKGVFLELELRGARLLSVNQVLGLHFAQRIAYRKAWHDAIDSAALLVTGNPQNRAAFDRYRLLVHRTSARLCDNDALNGHFKYAIDGMRYAGIVLDDDPRHMVSIHGTQSVGPYSVRLRVEAVNENEPYAPGEPQATAGAVIVKAVKRQKASAG